MHIHVSKKMLETTRFSIEKNGTNLNIKGYKADQVEGHTCEKCSLETFESNSTINVKQLTDKVCTCKPTVSPLISFKVDTSNTKIITLI